MISRERIKLLDKAVSGGRYPNTYTEKWTDYDIVTAYRLGRTQEKERQRSIKRRQQAKK